MRTTLDIQDKLLVKAKTVAARERKSLTRLIEEGLAWRIRRPASPKARLPVIPVSKGGHGFAPGIDPSSNASIYEAADDYT